MEQGYKTPRQLFQEHEQKARERKPCDHLWEYVNGPDDAANFLCSRCDAAMVAPVARSKPQ